MKLSGLLQKFRKSVDALPAKKILDMATIDAAKAIHMENEIGSIEEGKKADLVILDLDKPNTLPKIDDIYTRIVYSANSGNIFKVLVDGQIILEH
jgi:cytosine/adenosine deaminase-related metal-dependent hydrolase